MINIAICDDNEDIIIIIKQYIENYTKTIGINVNAECYLDGEDLLIDINEHASFDMIFLDIELNDNINGIEIGKKIRLKYPNIIIIFISSYDNYMYDMFSVNPFRFIKKPFNKEIIIKTFNETYKYLELFNEVFKFSTNKKTYCLPLKDIYYFEKNKRKVIINTKYGSYNYYAKLDDVLGQLITKNTKFMKLRSGFLVNVSFIKEYEFTKVKLLNNEIIIISESMRKS